MRNSDKNKWSFKRLLLLILNKSIRRDTPPRVSKMLWSSSQIWRAVRLSWSIGCGIRSLIYCLTLLTVSSCKINSGKFIKLDKLSPWLAQIIHQAVSSQQISELKKGRDQKKQSPEEILLNLKSSYKIKDKEVGFPLYNYLNPKALNSHTMISWTLCSNSNW